MARDPGRILLILAFTFTGISTIFVAFRLYVRHVVRRVGSCDYIMIFALLCTWACTIVNFYQNSFGKTKSNLDPYEEGRKIHSPEYEAALSGTLISWFTYRPLYIFTLSVVKLSILTFYRTLVPPRTSVRSFRPFRYTIWFLIVFISLYAVAMVVASVLQCNPIRDAYSNSAYLSQWDRSIPRPQCFDPTLLFAFSAIVNFTTDAIILLLPIPIVVSLRSMSRSKRIGVFVILSLGMATTAASAVRMYILVLWQKNPSTQVSYGIDLLIWGQVEINFGVIGACAPFMRPLFRRWKERKASKSSGMGNMPSPIEHVEHIRMGSGGVEHIRRGSGSSEISFADSRSVIRQAREVV